MFCPVFIGEENTVLSCLYWKGKHCFVLSLLERRTLFCPVFTGEVNTVLS